MSSKTVILVTGASGFVGSHVVQQLLGAGYAVRGTSRSGKAADLKKSINNPDFEVVIVDDLIEGDFSEALKGVHAVAHLASPLASSGNHIEVAVEGTLHVIRQAYAAGVYKVTVVSSIVAATPKREQMLDPDFILNESHWASVPEDAFQKDVPGWVAYRASKVLAEKATWEFVDEHPEMDIITLLPSFILGPIAPGQVITDYNSLSTNSMIYEIIHGKFPAGGLPQFVDVRDVARGVVLSLATPSHKVGEHHRVLLSPHNLEWAAVAKEIAKISPYVKARTAGKGEDPIQGVKAALVDSSNARKILGFEGFIPWERMVVDAASSLIENEWRIRA